MGNIFFIDSITLHCFIHRPQNKCVGGLALLLCVVLYLSFTPFRDPEFDFLQFFFLIFFIGPKLSF